MIAHDSTTRLLKACVATGLMLVAGWFFAPTLSDWQDDQLASRLLSQLEVAKDADVKVPLRQLASLGEAAIEPLVLAAASERTAIALIAQQILEEKLAIWQSQAESNQAEETSPTYVPSTLALATSLATHIHAFGPSGKQWAERQVLEIIDLTEILPPRSTRQLLENCTKVLAAVPARGPRIRTLSGSDQDPKLAAMTAMSAPEPRLDSFTRASEKSLEVFARIRPGQPRHPVQATSPQTTPTTLSYGSATKLPNSDLNWSRSNPQVAKLPPPTIPQHDNQNLAKSIPPTQPKPKRNIIDIPTPADMEAEAAQLSGQTNEQLFLRLLIADFYQTGMIRSVLVQRGFEETEISLRKQITEAQAAEKVRLVADVSQLSAAAAHRTLRWLTTDKHPEVRLRALTALATTNSPNLLQLARQLAVHDEDPRVAALAARLLRQTR